MEIPRNAIPIVPKKQLKERSLSSDWVTDQSFYCELYRRQRCRPCKKKCHKHCLELFHDLGITQELVSFAGTNVNHCFICRQFISLEYRKFHLCKGFPPRGRSQLYMVGITDNQFNQSSLIDPVTFWPFIQVFVGRLPNFNTVATIRPDHAACGMDGCASRYCIREAHFPGPLCRSPTGYQMSRLECIRDFPNQCLFCSVDISEASARLLHHCEAMPRIFQVPTEYQKGLSEWFSQHRSERRRRDFQSAVQQEKIIEHVQLKGKTCRCMFCNKNRHTKPFASVIIETVAEEFSFQKISFIPKDDLLPEVKEVLISALSDRDVIEAIGWPSSTNTPNSSSSSRSRHSSTKRTWPCMKTQPIIKRTELQSTHYLIPKKKVELVGFKDVAAVVEDGDGKRRKEGREEEEGGQKKKRRSSGGKETQKQRRRRRIVEEEEE